MKLKTWAIVLGVVLVLGFIGSLMSGSDDASNNATESSSSNTPTATKAALAPTKSDEKGAAAKAWLEANYADKAWVSEITKVYEQSGALWADTTYPADAEGEAIGKEICVALSGYEIQEQDGFSGVSVRAGDGQRLALRTSVGDDC